MEENKFEEEFGRNMGGRKKCRDDAPERQAYRDDGREGWGG